MVATFVVVAVAVAGLGTAAAASYFTATKSLAVHLPQPHITMPNRTS